MRTTKGKNRQEVLRGASLGGEPGGGCCDRPGAGIAEKSATPASPGPGERELGVCPACGRPGRPVKLVTVKSLLSSEATTRLDPGREWHFCPHGDCDVVYHSAELAYRGAEVRVPVFQREPGEDVPVCYCFGWTRRRIREEVRRTGRNTPAEEITAHVRAGRCACEIRNPQGGCCLPNVRRVAEEAAGVLDPSP